MEGGSEEDSGRVDRVTVCVWSGLFWQGWTWSWLVAVFGLGLDRARTRMVVFDGGPRLCILNVSVWIRDHVEGACSGMAMLQIQP